MNAFVAVKYDVEKLMEDVVSKLKSEYFVCVALCEFDEAMLATLRQAETIYFVVSKTSMCSTAYQMLIPTILPLVEIENCRLLKLDDTRIPAGFPLLQTLPEGKPT